MYHFILMLKDYIVNHNMHWFLVFFFFVLIRWLIVFCISLGYKKYDKVTDEEARSVFSSVLIPVVDEPVDVFRNVLNKILRQTPNELIVVVNGPYPKELMKLCQEVKKKKKKNNQKRNIPPKYKFYTLQSPEKEMQSVSAWRKLAQRVKYVFWWTVIHSGQNIL